LSRSPAFHDRSASTVPQNCSGTGSHIKQNICCRSWQLPSGKLYRPNDSDLARESPSTGKNLFAPRQTKCHARASPTDKAYAIKPRGARRRSYGAIVKRGFCNFGFVGRWEQSYISGVEPLRQKAKRPEYLKRSGAMSLRDVCRLKPVDARHQQLDK